MVLYLIRGVTLYDDDSRGSVVMAAKFGGDGGGGVYIDAVSCWRGVVSGSCTTKSAAWVRWWEERGVRAWKLELNPWGR